MALVPTLNSVQTELLIRRCGRGASRDLAPMITAMADASSVASVAVAGREPRAAADVMVKDVEAW
jgi:hypothetical protein